MRPRDHRTVERVVANRLEERREIGANVIASLGIHVRGIQCGERVGLAGEEALARPIELGARRERPRPLHLGLDFGHGVRRRRVEAADEDVVEPRVACRDCARGGSVQRVGHGLLPVEG